MFEIQTPALRHVVEDMMESTKALKEGSADLKEAAQRAKNGTLITNSVVAELKVRLAMPKINRFELNLKANKPALEIEKNQEPTV